MWKRLLLTTLVSAALNGPVLAADMTVGFSQVGSNLAGVRRKPT